MVIILILMVIMWFIFVYKIKIKKIIRFDIIYVNIKKKIIKLV